MDALTRAREEMMLGRILLAAGAMVWARSTLIPGRALSRRTTSRRWRASRPRDCA